MFAHRTTIRRVLLALILVGGCVGCAAIAGIGEGEPDAATKDAGARDSVVEPQSSSDAIATDDAPPSDEAPDQTFECPPTQVCTVGQQQCCILSATTASCAPVAAACPPYDAGVDADAGGPGGPPPKGNGPLLCNSYNNCFVGLQSHDCCWDPKGGSKCNNGNNHCGKDQESLCRIGFDKCGSLLFSTCQAFPDSPQTGIGHCPDGKP